MMMDGRPAGGSGAWSVNGFRLSAEQTTPGVGGTESQCNTDNSWTVIDSKLLYLGSVTYCILMSGIYLYLVEVCSL